MKEFLKVRECADESGLSKHFWRKLIKEKKIPVIKSGTTYYVNYPAAINIIRSTMIE